MLASVGRALEDADVAGFDDEEAGAGVAFGKDHLRCLVVARDDARLEVRELLFVQAGEERDATKDGNTVGTGLGWHRRIVSNREVCLEAIRT